MITGTEVTVYNPVTPHLSHHSKLRDEYKLAISETKTHVLSHTTATQSYTTVIPEPSVISI